MNVEPIQRPVPIPKRPAPAASAPAPAPAGPSFSISDVAYILFRHRWKISILGVVGLAVGTAFFFLTKTVYVSEAKLLVRYVLETGTVGPLDPGDQVKNPDGRGENIMNSEIELLTSLDLAEEVVTAVGPTNLLTKAGGGDSLPAAVNAFSTGLKLNRSAKSDAMPKSGNVIRIAFEHADATVARNVCAEVVNKYLRLHARVHGALDGVADLRQQADVKRLSIENSEAQLRKLKGDLGITSVAEAQKSISTLISSLEVQTATAEAALAEYRAVLSARTNQAAADLASTGATNALASATNGPASSTNGVAGATENAKTNSVALHQPSNDVKREYQAVLERLETLRKREQDLLLQFKPGSSYVQPVADQISETRRRRDDMVASEPGLTNVPPPAAAPRDNASGMVAAAGTLADSVRSLVADRGDDWVRVISAEAKVKTLREQLENARGEAKRLAEKEPEITKLERKLELEGKQYTFLSSAAEKATADASISTSRPANISVIQHASPAYLGTSKKLKIAGPLAISGFAIGLVWALVIEFVADSSLRRPAQVVSTLRVPLFLRLPRLRGMNGPSKSTPPPDDSEPPSGTTNNPMAPYCEALRDRLIMHFQLRDLHHKPKLIGVTSFGRGAGVTSVATSLAAALSETGEGNVLYVDVNPYQGTSLQPFHEGKLAGVQDALAEATRESTQIQEHLYAVSLSHEQSGRVGVLPRTLANLVPQMKASVYDYIIFDLPPVSQTSITARVAGLLDTTVVVVESEKTHAGFAGKASRLLAESNTHMVAVLNKHRRYLPRKMDSDL